MRLGSVQTSSISPELTPGKAVRSVTPATPLTPTKAWLPALALASMSDVRPALSMLFIAK